MGDVVVVGYVYDDEKKAYVRSDLLKTNKTVFKNLFGNDYFFEDGWNTYGLSLKGEKVLIEEILSDKRFLEKGIVFEKNVIDDDILEIKVIKSKASYYRLVSVELALDILKKYPSLKFAVFWDGKPLGAFCPELYVLYSESGTSEITDSNFVCGLSNEDEYCELYDVDILDVKEKKVRYHTSNSRNGQDSYECVKYSFPFIGKWNDNNYVDMEK